MKKIEIFIWIGGVVFALSGLGIGKIIDDPAFHIRAVQSDSHETVFILLALVIGFTIKDRTDDDSLNALLGAIVLAITAFFMNGLTDFENQKVINVGYGLFGAFACSLIGTLVYLMRALNSRQQR